MAGGLSMQSFEKGTKIKNGVLSIINLYGTWRDMGRQYGSMMSSELADIYENAVCKKLIDELGFDADEIKNRAHKLFANFPFRFKEVMRGMAETSGLDIEAIQLVNALEFIASDMLNPPQCTGIATWGDYAADTLIYGRNYDYLPWLKKLHNDIVIAVYHPADGSLATATLGYAGGIYAVNGMNEKGIFMELNNGMPSGGALWYDSRVPSVASLLGFLVDGASLDEIESFFQTTKSNFAYIIGVADGQTARCYEWPVFEVKRRESHSRQGLMVMSNHFTEFSWGLPRPDDKSNWMTRTRRQNLLTLAKHLKGTIDARTMMKIMDTKIEDLGATTEMTLYQLVTVPERYELWFKVPGIQEWTLIDMKELLLPRSE